MSGEIERMTLYLDLALVREAAEILGTDGISDTVHAALLAVVNRHKTQQLLEYDFPGLTLESLEQARGLRAAAANENFAGDGLIDHRDPL
ncbi:MAG TPA: hypothetical protein VIO57_12900 [Chloroflexota bacterium]